MFPRRFSPSAGAHQCHPSRATGAPCCAFHAGAARVNLSNRGRTALGHSRSRQSGPLLGRCPGLSRTRHVVSGVLAQALSAIRRKMRKIAGSRATSTTSIFHRTFRKSFRPTRRSVFENPLNIPCHQQKNAAPSGVIIDQPAFRSVETFRRFRLRLRWLSFTARPRQDPRRSPRLRIHMSLQPLASRASDIFVSCTTPGSCGASASARS